VRRWLVQLRRTRSQNTARTRYAGLRHFFRWLHEEGEVDPDPCEGVRGPTPAEAHTAVMSPRPASTARYVQGVRLRVAPRPSRFLLFLDGGLRLAELAGLKVPDVDLRDRMVYVVGKGSKRSGPRQRAVPIGGLAPSRMTCSFPFLVNVGSAVLTTASSGLRCVVRTMMHVH
jgi:site-specific recombinase XerC